MTLVAEDFKVVLIAFKAHRKRPDTASKRYRRNDSSVFIEDRSGYYDIRLSRA